jgi:hypothetical protein
MKARLQTIVTEQHGYLTKADVEYIAQNDRLRQLLVRCGCCRFTCPAQDVEHLVGMIGRDSTDYVRDVSLLASDPANRAKPEPPKRHPFPRDCEYGGAFDGFNVTSDADPGL